MSLQLERMTGMGMLHGRPAELVGVGVQPSWLAVRMRWCNSGLSTIAPTLQCFGGLRWIR